MAKYPQFDVEKCKSLRHQLRSAFNNMQTWENTGFDELDFTMGNMTYSENQVTLKLTIRVAKAPNKMMEDLLEFIKGRKFYGDEYNMISESGNYELIGYKPKNRKYPFIYLDHSSKRSFKTSREGMEKKFLKPKTTPEELEKIADTALKPLDDMLQNHMDNLVAGAVADVFPKGIDDSIGG